VHNRSLLRSPRWLRLITGLGQHRIEFVSAPGER